MAAGGDAFGVGRDFRSSSILYSKPPVPRAPLTPILAPQPLAASAPAGINPLLFQKAKAALATHQIGPRDVIGIVDFSEALGRRVHVVDLMSSRVDSYRVAHGQGSDPNPLRLSDRFSNEFGSYATSNGTYITGAHYQGEVRPFDEDARPRLDQQQCRAARVVIHNAWYAEPGVVAAHGKLGRSQGCFAFSKEDQYPIMKRLSGGRMIYADKVA